MSYDRNTMKIAGSFTVADWKKLDLSHPGAWDDLGWTKAIDIFETRIRRRFVEPIDALIKMDRELYDAMPVDQRKEDAPTFGFAILALDCLLIETLQGVTEGELDHKDISCELFVRFVEQAGSLRRHFGRRGSAKQFYYNYRCALLHRGATEGAFLVAGIRSWKIGGDEVGVYLDRADVHAVNRTKFHAAVVTEFSSILKRLRGPPRSGNSGDATAMIQSRQNLKRVFDAICA